MSNTNEKINKDKINVIDLIPSLKNLDSKDYLQSIQEYYDSICYLSENHLSLEFNNKDMYHGTLVMTQLFKNAKKSIKIFAGDYNGDISDNDIYINSLRDALNNTSINTTVIFEKDPKKSKGFQLLSEFNSKKSGNLTVLLLKHDYKQKLERDFGKIEHFTLVDDISFRYETDTIEYRAFCNFDDKVNSEILAKNFENLMINSSPFSF